MFPSQWLASEVVARGWNLPANITILQNAVPKYLSDLRTRSSSQAITEFVFFGRLSILKGLETFCDALDIISSSQKTAPKMVTFLGLGQSIHGYTADAYIALRSQKWSFPVKVVTTLDSEQAVSYLAQPGRLAIAPSLLDASPYSVLECLHAGIPFIASDLPGIASLISPQDWPRVLVPPGDHDALAARLLQSLASPAPVASPARDAASISRQWISLHEQVIKARTPLKVTINDDKPLVSVVLVHRNRHLLLKQAIQSLDAQTYKNFEVILVDDGSDNPASLSYLRKLTKLWAQRGWQIIFSTNQYLGAARNQGAKAAIGKYILFMDDDDYAKPHQLEVFSFVAEHTGANVVTTGHDLLQSNEAPDALTPVTYRYIPLGSATKVGLTENCFGDSNMFVKRTFFIAFGGFTEDYGVGFEDYEYLAKVSLAGETIQVVANPLHWYRKLGESMSTQTDETKNLLRFIRAYDGASLEHQPLLDAFFVRVSRNSDEPCKYLASPRILLTLCSFTGHGDINR